MPVQNNTITNASKSSKHWRSFKLNFELLLLALPGIIFIFIFSYLPMPGVVLAFENFKGVKGIFGSPWVGLENFRFLFMTDDVVRITANTVIMNLLFILTGTAFSMTLALMLYEVTKKYMVKIYQTIIIFPNFLSWVIVSYMFYTIMSSEYGMLNQLLGHIGLIPVDWYSSPQYWRAILVVTNLWKGGGIGCIIYYSCLMGINREYFEAASIDGASKLQCIRYISIPFLIPMITILTILNIGSIIRADFGMFYNLTRDVPALYSTTDVIDTYVYRALRQVGDTGMAAAAGLYQSVVGFLLIFITNAIVRKISPENSLY